MLEQLLPEWSLRHLTRTKWATLVLENFTRLEAALDRSEIKLMRMSRVMALMQRMKIFGCYWWMGHQILAPGIDANAIARAPKEVCKINPRVPEGEYWICMDLHGVRFVATDDSFQRGFMFSEEAVERVVCCGAKQQLIQFVVSTINPSMPAMGRVPMTISLQCPAAADIAYAVHVIHDKGEH